MTAISLDGLVAKTPRIAGQNTIQPGLDVTALKIRELAGGGSSDLLQIALDTGEQVEVRKGGILPTMPPSEYIHDLYTETLGGIRVQSSAGSGARVVVDVLDSGVSDSVKITKGVTPTMTAGVESHAALTLVGAAPSDYPLLETKDGVGTVLSQLWNNGLITTSRLQVGTVRNIGVLTDNSPGVYIFGNPIIGDLGSNPDTGVPYLPAWIKANPVWKPTSELSKQADGIVSNLAIEDDNAGAALTGTYSAFRATPAAINPTRAITGAVVGFLAASSVAVSTDGAASVVSALEGFRAALSVNAGSGKDSPTAVATSGRAFFAASPTLLNGGTITTNYGLLINDQAPAGVGTGHAIYLQPQTGFGITYQLAATPSANILQVLASGGGQFVSGISKDGYYVVANHSAPADGDIAAGQCFLWYDQTNGAAKLMLKAKTNTAAVVTASVALS